MKNKMSLHRRTLSPAIITLIIIGCTVIFVSFLYVFRQSLTSRETASAEVKSDNPALEARMSKIASQFLCACGDCTNQTLDQCPCETAQSARQTIRASLQAGEPVGKIIATIDSAFGGRLQTPPEQMGSNQEITTSQRTEVLSHFRCPCGKCGMENLAECECDHPHGGKEVRAFLDQKLSDKNYSQDQLVAEIEKTYGGRKF